MVSWAAGAAAEVPPAAAAGAWAAKRRASRSGSPGSSLHLGMCIAVYLLALGIPNRVCWSVVLKIATVRITTARRALARADNLLIVAISRLSRFARPTAEFRFYGVL